MNDDTDADDDDSFTVTQIKKNGGSNSAVNASSTYTSNGTSVTGSYGTLTIGADGSYTYTADHADADALDAGDTATGSSFMPVIVIVIFAVAVPLLPSETS